MTVLTQMLGEYETATADGTVNGLREVMTDVALAGFYRGGFLVLRFMQKRRSRSSLKLIRNPHWDSQPKKNSFCGHSPSMSNALACRTCLLAKCIPCFSGTGKPE